jgi:hypothetical protein
VVFLGVTICNGTVCPEQSKIDAIDKWPVPRTKKQLQSFLGFCNIYCCFIKDYSKVARPLYNITKNVYWSWNNPQEDAFKDLKQRMTTYPILRIPIDGKPF